MQMEERISKREELCRQGILEEAYGADSFFRVYPCYGIDCVKFSFVKIGSNGEGFDLYINMDIFDNLCDEILNGELKKKVLAEKSTAENRYPHSFKWTGGEKGQKELKISAARSANSEVNIYGKSDKAFMNVPVTWNKLLSMAKYFKRTSRARFEELSRLIINAAKEQEEKYHSNKNRQEDKEYVGNTEKPMNEPVETEPKNEAPTQNTTQTAEQTGSQQPVNDKPEVTVTLSLRSSIEKIEGKNLYVATVQDENKKETQLYFNKESLLNLGKNSFDELVRKSNNTRKPKLQMLAATSKGTYLLKKLLA